MRVERKALVFFPTLNKRLSTALLVGCVTLARGLAAEGNSSLSESKIESAEQKITAQSLLAQNEDLRRQLSIQQESLKTLTASLAESNAEAEVFRRKFSDLELRMEALGLASASKDRAKLEQRLLAAVSDLRLTQKERDELRDQLLGLNEALLRYLQTSQGGDAQARMDVEAHHLHPVFHLHFFPHSGFSQFLIRSGHKQQFTDVGKQVGC